MVKCGNSVPAGLSYLKVVYIYMYVFFLKGALIREDEFITRREDLNAGRTN